MKIIKVEKIVSDYQNGDEWLLEDYPSSYKSTNFADLKSWGVNEVNLQQAKVLANELTDFEFDIDIEEAKDFFELQDVLDESPEYQRDNSYNQSWWGGVIDFGVLVEGDYDRALCLVRFHIRGDVRGNYTEIKAFEMDSYLEEFPMWRDRLTYQIETDKGRITLDSDDWEGYSFTVIEDETGTFEEEDYINLGDLEEKFDTDNVDLYNIGGAIAISEAMKMKQQQQDKYPKSTQALDEAGAWFLTGKRYDKGGSIKKPRLKKGDKVEMVGKRWFQRSYGNTYHTVKVYVNDKLIGETENSHYGYDEQFLQTGLDILFKHYLPPYKWNGSRPAWTLKNYGIKFDYDYTDVARERDLFSLGGEIEDGYKLYDTILQGYEGEEFASDYARAFDWGSSEYQMVDSLPTNKRYIDTISGIDIYYDYGADYYFFVDSDESFDKGGNVSYDRKLFNIDRIKGNEISFLDVPFEELDVDEKIDYILELVDIHNSKMNRYYDLAGEDGEYENFKFTNGANPSKIRNQAEEIADEINQRISDYNKRHPNEFKNRNLELSDFPLEYSLGGKIKNYMFFSNLKQMRRQIDIMLENFNPYWVDSTLADGHDWADDKVSESKTNLDGVFDFFMSEKDEEEFARGGITKNNQIIDQFLDEKTDNELRNISIHYSTLGDVMLLRNYGTLIAKRKGNKVSISNKKYSSTTSTIQNSIERMAKSRGMKVLRIDPDEFETGGNVSYNVDDLLMG